MPIHRPIQGFLCEQKGAFGTPETRNERFTVAGGSAQRAPID
jgi:hypothetical protein